MSAHIDKALAIEKEADNKLRIKINGKVIEPGQQVPSKGT